MPIFRYFWVAQVCAWVFFFFFGLGPLGISSCFVFCFVSDLRHVHLHFLSGLGGSSLYFLFAPSLLGVLGAVPIIQQKKKKSFFITIFFSNFLFTFHPLSLIYFTPSMHTISCNEPWCHRPLVIAKTNKMSKKDKRVRKGAEDGVMFVSFFFLLFLRCFQYALIFR